MRTKSLEGWIWVLIYGGLLAVGLGLAVSRSDGALGSGIAWAGGAVALVGFVLIFVRARMKGEEK